MRRLVLVSNFLLVFLCACATAPQFTRSGILRDQLFSVEQRGNGITILWLVHDDIGAYCVTTEVEEFQTLRGMLLEGSDVIIEYHDIEYNDVTPCARAESSSDSGEHQTYVVESIRLAKE